MKTVCSGSGFLCTFFASSRATHTTSEVPYGVLPNLVVVVGISFSSRRRLCLVTCEGKLLYCYLDIISSSSALTLNFHLRRQGYYTTMISHFWNFCRACPALESDKVIKPMANLFIDFNMPLNSFRDSILQVVVYLKRNSFYMTFNLASGGCSIRPPNVNKSWEKLYRFF